MTEENGMKDCHSKHQKGNMLRFYSGFHRRPMYRCVICGVVVDIEISECGVWCRGCPMLGKVGTKFLICMDRGTNENSDSSTS